MSVSVEQLPDLSSDYTVTPEQIAHFQEHGHIVLRKIASQEELDAYYPYLEAAVERFRKERRKLEERGTYHKAFVQVGNLWVRDEFVKRFTLARRFAKIAADLMGVDGVRIYHDQALFKEPGGGHTPWHQDQYYWPIGSDKTVTMWMPFKQAPIEKGAMTFASHMHRSGPLAQLGIGDESSKFFSQHLMETGAELRTYELNPGDATWHTGWTPHKAPGNSTDEMRPVMTIIYHAADARICEPMNDAQPVDMEAFFPGLKPGDVCASELNPLVFHRDPSKMS